MTPSATPGLVSCVIPVRNRPEMLREAVESVIAQDYRPIEVIIVDDGSAGGTAREAEALAFAHPGEVFAIHQEHRGPGPARENGRRRIRGEFLQYLDSDDVLLPNKFSRQVAGLRAHPECGVSYGWTRERRADGGAADTPRKGSGEKHDTMFPQMLLWRWWDTPTPLYRAALCDLAGPWTDLSVEEDWEMDCRIASLGVRLHFVEGWVAEVREHGGDRLSRNVGAPEVGCASRARAHILIYTHATLAGIGPEAPEMRHFARELFFLCRQCGAAGLVREARELFALARRASGRRRARGADFVLYRAASAAVGWEGAARLATLVDRVREQAVAIASEPRR